MKELQLSNKAVLAIFNKKSQSEYNYSMSVAVIAICEYFKFHCSPKTKA